MCKEIRFYKKVFLLSLGINLIFLLSGCGDSSSNDSKNNQDDNNTSEIVVSSNISTVVDKVTNLIWTDGSDTKTVTRTFPQAQAYCNNLEVDNYSDWRIPSLSELYTIVDLKNHNPSIKNTFLYTTSSGYWSSDRYPIDNNLIMGINFYDGGDGVILETDNYYTRCVRGEPLATPSFTKTGDTVVENSSTLEWQDNGEVVDNYLNYSEAMSYCDSIALSNHNDWRVPTLDELRTIVDRDNSNPTLYKEFTTRVSDAFWSSSIYEADDSKMWSILFRDGNDFKYLKIDKAYVRCVR